MSREELVKALNWLRAKAATSPASFPVDDLTKPDERYGEDIADALFECLDEIEAAEGD